MVRLLQSVVEDLLDSLDDTLVTFHDHLINFLVG